MHCEGNYAVQREKERAIFTFGNSKCSKISKRMLGLNPKWREFSVNIIWNMVDITTK